MTYTPTIYDWRTSVEPISQLFLAPSQSVSGGMLLGGASYENPEPGGRAELRLEFVPFANANTNLDASWLATRIQNGNIMRIRLWGPTPQLVSDAALGVSAPLGLNWSNGKGWANGYGWEVNPSADITVAGVKGGTTFTANLNPFGQVLQIGHVIGFSLSGLDFAHLVTDISYSANNRATVTVSPPLRRDVPGSARMLFRPVMLATCINGADVATNFKRGNVMAFNDARFVEALV